MSFKKSLLWSYISRYASAALQFASTLFLARLLTPDEIGTYAVALSLIAFVYLLRDFGVAEYLVQEKDLTNEKIRSAYTLGLIFSCILGVSVFFSAEWIADFYQKQEIKDVVQLISVNFFLIPISATIFSLLRRNMQFKFRTYIEVSSELIHALVAVSLAYSGFGVLSLAFASVSGNILTVILCQWVRPKDFSYVPSLKFKNVRSIMAYGGFASASQFIRLAGHSAPNILIGKILGMASVGFFNRGSTLIKMLHQVLFEGLRPVLMPYFSQIQRKNENPENAYIMIITIISAVMLSCYAFIFIESSILIELLFGAQWLESIPLLQVVCISRSFSIIVVFSDELFKATGHIKKFFMIETLMAPLRILTVFIGIQFDLLTMVVLLAGLGLVRVFITNYIIFKYFEINIKNYIQMLLKNLSLLIVSIGPLLIMHHFYLLEQVYIRLLVDAIIISITWISGMFLIHRQVTFKLLSFVGLHKTISSK